jgi:tripartite-type tricarboxylate transporter receptor subunit TctC
MLKRNFLKAFAIAAYYLRGATVGAQGLFPNRPVKIIVPFPPGALTDSNARLLALQLQLIWQQPVVVENRPGASGNIGTEVVFRSKPDGYTLLFTPQSPLTLAKLITPQLNFEPENMSAISIVTRSTVLLVVNPKLPVRNVQQLISYGLANPGKLNFASTGVGTTAQLANDLFFKISKVQGVSIPYQGVAPATTALLTGDVDVMFDAMGNSLANIKSGKLRAIAICGNSRNPNLPDVESTSETMPEFIAPLWSALAGPPNLPMEIAKKISLDVAQVLRSPEFVTRFNQTPGLEAVGNRPEEMQQAIKHETQVFSQLFKTISLPKE